MQNIINSLEELSRIKNDKNLKEFVEQIILLKKSFDQSKEINTNNVDCFYQKAEEYIKTSQDDQEYQNFFLKQLGAIVIEYKQKGYIDLSIYYKNFSKEYSKEIENYEFEDDEKSIEMKNKLDELINLIEDNQNLTEKKINLEKNITYLNEAEYQEPQLKKEANFEDLISFIKNKNQVYYPFNREDTLDNIGFMLKFKTELLKFSLDDIQKMTESLKEKNKILEAELKNLMNEKHKKIDELSNEMLKNSDKAMLLFGKKNNEENIMNNEKETFDQNEALRRIQEAKNEILNLDNGNSDQKNKKNNFQKNKKG